ncbi:uncharacterized protein [Phaenicophaeus curvirostris]|uniref:uncharacterized protein n=1 Tax=Phaenicophaeus curvirostris TaxID=33595 RepID=UPI0037F0DBB3
MGRQRAQPVPSWRQLLRAGCWWLLSLSGMAIRGLRWLWKLVWFLLICYKSCWDGAFQATEELGRALRLRLENSSEGSEEDGDSSSALDSGQAGQRWSSSSSEVTPSRPCWEDWRHWRLMFASSAPSWVPRSCCGAAGSWRFCRSSKVCASGCRNGRGAGTASTAPSCQGKRRMKVPVGAKERALQDASGWSPPSSQPRAQAAVGDQWFHDRQKK